MKVISVNLGERKQVQWKRKLVETGIYKFPVKGPIYLDMEDVANDAVIDRKHHGGIDQAVYAYSQDHYAYWEEQYPDLDWACGMFGENLTIEDLDEKKLRVGSVYQLGEAQVEVTKPRQPCYKLGIRFNDQKVVKQFWNSTKCGTYFKILKPGKVQVGDQLILVDEHPENPTIAEVYERKRISKGM